MTSLRGRLTVRWTWALALFGLLVALPAQAGLIVNGGFETGSLGPWYQDRVYTPGYEDWNVTSADFHSGLYSATDVGNRELRQDFAATPTSLITRVSLWIRQPTGLALFAYDFFYSDGSFGEFPGFPSTTGWEYFDVTSNLDAGKSLVGFSVWGYYGGAEPWRTYVDDVTIEAIPGAIPEPASLTLLGLGLAALALAAIRRKAA